MSGLESVEAVLEMLNYNSTERITENHWELIENSLGYSNSLFKTNSMPAEFELIYMLTL